MYSIVIMEIPISNASNTSIIETFIADESEAIKHKEILPLKIGSTLTVRTFPNSWTMLLTTVTKIQ